MARRLLRSGFMLRILIATSLLCACTNNDDPIADELDQAIENSVTDCGDLLFGNGGNCPVLDPADAIACFNSSENPRIKQTMISIEGDPIIDHFFGPNAPAVVRFHDTRQDAFGAQELTRSDCRALAVSDSAVGPNCKFVVCGE